MVTPPAKDGDKRREIGLSGPFHVDDGVLVVDHLLADVSEGVIRFPYSVMPNRRLEAAHMRRREVAAFVEAALPDDLAERLRGGTRCASLWSECVELWAEAYGRTDLMTLAVASRRRVVECEALLERFTRFLRRADARPSARQRPAVTVHFRAEAARRGEPWTELYVDRVMVELKTIADVKAPTAMEEEEARRELESKSGYIEEELRRALDVLEGSASGEIRRSLATVAMLAIPGISLADVREILLPAGLERSEWVDMIVRVLGGGQCAAPPGGTLELFSQRDDEWSLEPREKRRGQPTARDDKWSLEPKARRRGPPTARDLLMLSTTRLLYHPDVQALVAEALWERVGEHRSAPKANRLRVHFQHIHSALRRRYRQTLNRYYQRVSVLFRLLAANPARADGGALREAAARCSREILSSRMREDPTAEAELYRWLDPHLDKMPHEIALGIQQLRAEFQLVTSAVLHATLHRSSSWSPGPAEEEAAKREALELRARELVELCRRPIASLSKALPGLKEKVEGMRASDKQARLRERFAHLDSLCHWQERRLAGLRSSWKEEIEGIAGIIGPMLTSSYRLSGLCRSLQDESKSKFRREVLKLRREMHDKRGRLGRRFAREAFVSLLFAQAALLWHMASGPWTPVEYDWREEARDDWDLPVLADKLLKDALGRLERPLRRRSYMIVRLLLAMDLRIAIGRGPDMTFLGPVRELLEGEGGPEVKARLERLGSEIAHRELLSRDVEKSGIQGERVWGQIRSLIGAVSYGKERRGV